MCEINVGFYFFPFFVLNAFSILIFATALGLLALCMGCASVWCAYFTSIGFISHVGSRQVS